MRFEKLLTEGDTSDATNMEKVIVALWNGESEDKGDLKKHNHLIDQGGSATVQSLKSVGVTGTAEHYGQHGSDGITKEWGKWGARDSTPKTDFIIGSHRISLKKVGGSQLMSAKMGETRATVMTALSKSGITEKQFVGQIDQYIQMMVSSRSPDNVSRTRGVKNNPMGSVIVDADTAHKEIQKIFRKTFSNNDNFKKEMVREAMTGDTKFGSNSKSRAGWILVFDPKGSAFKWNSTDDDTFLREKASKTKVVIGWKSVGVTKRTNKVTKPTGEYDIFSSFRLSEDIQEGLNEGALDAVIRAKDWIKRQWAKIKKWLSQSWDNILTFAGIEPDVVMGDTQF